jgi:hypothetical protein
MIHDSSSLAHVEDVIGDAAGPGRYMTRRFDGRI